jgi:hypothetical protein
MPLPACRPRSFLGCAEPAALGPLVELVERHRENAVTDAGACANTAQVFDRI